MSVLVLLSVIEYICAALRPSMYRVWMVVRSEFVNVSFQLNGRMNVLPPAPLEAALTPV